MKKVIVLLLIRGGENTRNGNLGSFFTFEFAFHFGDLILDHSHCTNSFFKNLKFVLSHRNAIRLNVNLKKKNYTQHGNKLINTSIETNHSSLFRNTMFN